MDDVDPPTARQPALLGRSIQVVSDLSLEEQLYLFERARRLKSLAFRAEASENPAQAPLCEVHDAQIPEKVDSPDSTVYLAFVDGSTRTRESLRNAGVYHGVKVNEFQAQSSSFQKSETITDTMKMLSVYSMGRTVFVIRSQMEGVCSWLETVMPEHAEKHGVPRPAFLNAGDGRYSHPLGELVDDFSILEQKGWSRASLHIALVGDLANGRTAHSKVDGLRIFEQVSVDLIAPDQFAYPVEYRNRMRAQGFQVREFESVEEYLRSSADSVATVWYFFQPQISRWGDKEAASLQDLLRRTSFQEEWRAQLPKDTRFFQTLPRSKQLDPIIPLSLDKTPLNSWDRHANNAYFLYVVLLSMLFGKIGYGIPDSKAKADVAAKSRQRRPSAGAGYDDLYPLRGEGPAQLPSFLQRVQIAAEEHRRRPERARPGGPMPIEDGLVVDHIGTSSDGASCWRTLRITRSILGWNARVGCEGVFESASRGQGKSSAMKGILSLPGFDFEQVTVPQMKVLASVAPGCTINAVKASRVVQKYRLSVPERIYNLPGICCRNEQCLSFPRNKQRDVVTYFERVPFYETSVLPGCKSAEYLFVCRYCKWPHQYEDIWSEGILNV